ncbi:MAG: peptide deformylase [Patescibacteria group bacterium]
MLTIITHPHKTLRQRASEVKAEEIPSLKKFIDELSVTMQTKDGVGLAATQVNILKRIIVISTKDGPLPLINPVLSRKSFRKDVAEEGCLSVPGVYGLVKRHRSLVINALDRKGNPLTIKARGMFARIALHEVDHLDGVLFIDRTKKITKGILPHEPKNL